MKTKFVFIKNLFTIEYFATYAHRITIQFNKYYLIIFSFLTTHSYKMLAKFVFLLYYYFYLLTFQIYQCR